MPPPPSPSPLTHQASFTSLGSAGDGAGEARELGRLHLSPAELRRHTRALDFQSILVTALDEERVTAAEQGNTVRVSEVDSLARLNLFGTDADRQRICVELLQFNARDHTDVVTQIAQLFDLPAVQIFADAARALARANMVRFNKKLICSPSSSSSFLVLHCVKVVLFVFAAAAHAILLNLCFTHAPLRRLSGSTSCSHTSRTFCRTTTGTRLFARWWTSMKARRPGRSRPSATSRCCG